MNKTLDDYARDTLSKRNFCSFDVETAKLAPSYNDANPDYNIGITCAATVSTDDSIRNREPRLWWEGMDSLPGLDVYGPRMSEATIKRLVYYLGEQLLNGYYPFTWNGAGFEFRVIAAEFPQLSRACKFLALNHVDGFFQMYTLTGNFVGLDAALRGMGLPGKGKSGITGKDAPELWKTDPKRVLEYVKEDVVQPLQFAHRAMVFGYIVWTAKGNSKVNKFGKYKYREQGWGSTDFTGWLTVAECFNLMPEPDTSHFTRYGKKPPQTRREMLSWLEHIPALDEKDVGILPEDLVNAARQVPEPTSY